MIQTAKYFECWPFDQRKSFCRIPQTWNKQKKVKLQHFQMFRQQWFYNYRKQFRMLLKTLFTRVNRNVMKTRDMKWIEVGLEWCCVSWGCKIYPGQNINLTTLVRPARNSWCWCDVAKFTQAPRLTSLRQIYIILYTNHQYGSIVHISLNKFIISLLSLAYQENL